MDLRIATRVYGPAEHSVIVYIGQVSQPPCALVSSSIKWGHY